MIPRREPDQRHYSAIGCNKTKRHDGYWMFGFWQKVGTLALFPKRQVAVVPSISRRIDRPSLLITLSAGADLRLLTNIWKRSRRLAWIAIMSSVLSTMTPDLSLSLATACRTVAAPNPNFLACWPMDVLGLFRIHNSLSITACTSVDTLAIVYALLDCVDGCARHPDKVSDLTHFVSSTKKYRHFHSIISAVPFWNTQQWQTFSSMS